MLLVALLGHFVEQVLEFVLVLLVALLPLVKEQVLDFVLVRPVVIQELVDHYLVVNLGLQALL